MVDSSQTQLAYIAESTYGTTPATPALSKVRFTGESLNANINNVVSNEIRPDRNVPDLVQVGSAASGNVNFELSYGSFDDWLESVMFGAWSTNVLKNGTTQKSFTFEKLFEAGATDQYHRFTGCIADTMTLNVASQAIVTGAFGFLAQGMESAQAAIVSSTYNDPNTNPLINAAKSFASLSITGVTTPQLTEINLNVSNNLRQQPVLGSINSKGLGKGRSQVSGSLMAYFENHELYELFLDAGESALSFKLGGASNLNYVFDIPRIKFSNGTVVASGNDQDVMAQMEFTGLYDTAEDCTLKITRTPAF